MTSDSDTRIDTRKKVQALFRVGTERPLLTVGIILLSVVAALLEGIGLSFVVPIIRLAQSSGSVSADSSSLLGVFISVYQFIGIPFRLDYIIGGVTVVMAARYTTSFLVAWLRASLRTEYVRSLQLQSFTNALDADVEYFDKKGSDEILNAIITQSNYAGRVISQVVRIIEQTLLCLMYFGLALYLVPLLTITTCVVLGGFVYIVRNGLESGYSVGSRVASANEKVQETVQKGTQGIREVKIYGMAKQLQSEFDRAINRYAKSTIKLHRNEAAIENVHQFLTAVTVFALIYIALNFTALSLGGLGAFLFAMFRLGPRISFLNEIFYQAEGNLPHLVRTQNFIEELQESQEGKPIASMEEASSIRNVTDPPEKIEEIRFEEVTFSYDKETVFRELSFSVERGEFIAFVGPSGAGKSTIVSLLTRMYEPDDGDILANRISIAEFDIDEWRSNVATVRQNPYIFNDTLEYNVTLGDSDATADEMRKIYEVAQVTEFLDDLPQGYNTVLGDDGVRLSGGQQQRVAIARALHKAIVHDVDLLVLDEATSDLDLSLEREVHTGIESFDHEYAVILIAHRLSTVTNADQIYTIENRGIIESGTHQELLDSQGKYAELYNTQR